MNNKLLPVIGALIGAIIGTIPWILVYVYLGYILSILSFVIAIISLKGYELLGGKKNKNTVYLIIISSFIAITIATFILIPLLVNLKNGLGFSIDKLKLLYTNNNFFSTIIGDYIISVLFTILGIGGVIRSLKNDVNEFNIENKYTKEDKQLIINIFKSKNALSKSAAITRWEFEKEIDINKYKDLINDFKTKGIIVGNSKLYLEEKSITDLDYRNKVLNKERLKIILIIVFIFLGVLLLITIISSNTSNTANKQNNNIEEKLDGYKLNKIAQLATYNLPNYLGVYEDNTNNEYYDKYGFYSITYTPNLSYRGDIYFRTIYVDYLEDYYYDDFNSYKEKVLNSSKDGYIVSSVNLITNINNLEIIEIKAKGFDNKLYYDYYTFYNGDSLFFEFVSTNNYSDQQITNEISNVLNSVKYIKTTERTY